MLAAAQPLRLRAAGPALYAIASTMAFSVALGRIAVAVFSGFGR